MKKNNSGPVLSLVVPAYQEELVISDTLDRIAEYLKVNKLSTQTEIIIVSADGSDNTHDLVSGKKHLFKTFKFLRPGAKVGKGRDVRLGMLAAKGKYVMFMDADLATPLHHVKSAIEMLEHGADIVIGVRELEKIHSGLRKIVSISANRTSRMLVAPGFNDTQCGFKAFRKNIAADLFSKMTIMGWAFDMELIYIARLRGYIVAELPIPDWTEHKPAEMQLAGESGAKAAVRTFFEVLKIRKNGLYGLYEKNSETNQQNAK